MGRFHRMIRIGCKFREGRVRAVGRGLREKDFGGEGELYTKYYRARAFGT